jgi:hypothetical protein
MAPGAKVLEAELGKTVDQLWFGDADRLTVNYVRTVVAKKLKLDEDFFLQEAWKARSKQLIKKRVVCLRKLHFHPPSPPPPGRGFWHATSALRRVVLFCLCFGGVVSLCAEAELTLRPRGVGPVAD